MNIFILLFLYMFCRGEDQDVGRWTILKWILERLDGIDWIDLAQDRDQWWALVNTAMNLRVP
jgi:hypothetical protein